MKYLLILGSLILGLILIFKPSDPVVEVSVNPHSKPKSKNSKKNKFTAKIQSFTLNESAEESVAESEELADFEEPEEMVYCEPQEIYLCSCSPVEDARSCHHDQSETIISIYNLAFPNELPENIESTNLESLSQMTRLIEWKKNQFDDYPKWESAKRSVLAGYSCYVEDISNCYIPAATTEDFAAIQDQEFQVAGEEWQPRDDDEFNYNQMDHQ